jgi:hypothetical protein
MTHRGGGRRLVLAFFDCPAVGDAVVRVLEQAPGIAASGGTVGCLTLGLHGDGSVSRLGPRTAPGGPGVGAVLGVVACALTDGTSVAPGSLFDGGSDLSTDDLARFAAELEAGQTMVAVLDRRSGAERAVLELAGFGGKVEVHWLSHGALRRAVDLSAALARQPPGP